MRRAQFLAYPTAIATVAGLALAVTAAVAYERADQPAMAIVATAIEAPGVDLMVTGPVGPTKPSKAQQVRPAREAADRPVRRRMHLN